jgi:hypothetical protein
VVRLILDKFDFGLGRSRFNFGLSDSTWRAHSIITAAVDESEPFENLDTVGKSFYYSHSHEYEEAIRNTDWACLVRDQTDHFYLFGPVLLIMRASGCRYNLKELMDHFHEQGLYRSIFEK